MAIKLLSRSWKQLAGHPPVDLHVATIISDACPLSGIAHRRDGVTVAFACAIMPFETILRTGMVFEACIEVASVGHDRRRDVPSIVDDHQGLIGAASQGVEDRARQVQTHQQLRRSFVESVVTAAGWRRPGQRSRSRSRSYGRNRRRRSRSHSRSRSRSSSSSSSSSSRSRSSRCALFVAWKALDLTMCTTAALAAARMAVGGSLPICGAGMYASNVTS